MESAATDTTGKNQRLSDRAFYGLAVGLLFFAFLAVFLLNRDRTLASAAISSFSNLVPLLIVSVAARSIVGRYLIGASLIRQLSGHVLLAALFALLWYWLLMVLIGVRSGGSVTEFVVKAFFDRPAMTWQMLQGLTLYALIACITYMRAQPPSPSFVVAPAQDSTAGKDPAPSRYFIRQGEDLRPIDVSQIVSIAGADDYAEVATMSGRHLVRMTLNEFEKTLEGENFIRVHRSRIVNIDRITRAEPAGGGRMLLHMEDGEIVQASRAGTKLLRDRVI
jgi:hypothetical protein